MLDSSGKIVWFKHTLKRGDTILEGEFSFFHPLDKQLVAGRGFIQAGDGIIEIMVFFMQADEPLTQGCCRIKNIVVHLGLGRIDRRICRQLW
jgi:hypothetical protein